LGLKTPDKEREKRVNDHVFYWNQGRGEPPSLHEAKCFICEGRQGDALMEGKCVIFFSRPKREPKNQANSPGSLW